MIQAFQLFLKNYSCYFSKKYIKTIKIDTQFGNVYILSLIIKEFKLSQQSIIQTKLTKHIS